MDFPIEINSNPNSKSKEEITKDKNNLYFRYYLCMQTKNGIECKKFDYYEEIEEQNDLNLLYLTKWDDKNHTNGVFPIYNFTSVCFKVNKFIPSFFDGLILKYNLHNLLDIYVKK